MKRNKFSLSHTKLLSCNMGKLVPVGLIEVLPGDSIQMATSALVRCAPMLAPVMHRCDVRIHHWFVPHRLSWDAYNAAVGNSERDSWEKFITGGPDGDDTSTPPQTNLASSWAAKNLADYYGLASPGSNNPMNVSYLPFVGYNMIYNKWYRDEDLVDAVTVGNTDLLPVMWEKDYFTSARPFEAKGPTITIPLGTSAPVVGDASSALGLSQTSADGELVRDGSDFLKWQNVSGTPATGGVNVNFDPDESFLRADLTGASAVTINVFREALALQRYQEARARFGSRYTEYLRYLGVRADDARLQNPEYLGGGRNVLQFSEVLQTAPTATAGSVVGNLKGHGIAGMRSNRFRRFFSEHGYIHSLMSVRPKTIYMQGVPRTFLRRTKEDFWQKELETIGQQEITDKEIYAASATPDEMWGFQDRYDEYRRVESSVAGEFRDTTLDFWHMARKFSSTPDLNDEFVECVPTERIFAASDPDVLYVMCNHSVQARRMLQKTGRSLTF